MKKIAALLAVGLVLAGCSGESGRVLPEATYSDEADNVGDDKEDWPSEWATTPSDDAGAAEPAAPAEPEYNARGHIETNVGDEGIVFATDAPADPPYPLTFTVTAIEPNYQCTGEWSEPSENGQFLAVSMTLVTGPDLQDISYGDSLHFSESDFQIIGTDGVVENNIDTFATYSCLSDSESFPMSGVGPSLTANVKFVLDTKAASGYLVFEPLGIQHGWEYEF